MISQPAHRKLLFHIGHHKTGSTSIQNAFAAGKVRLVGGRILYPGKLSHNYLRRGFETYLREGRVLPDAEGFPGLATISERLRPGNFNFAVFSGEAFEDVAPAGFLKVLREFILPHVTDHAVICYVRPHAARILSGFGEGIKVGQVSAPLDIFVANAIKNGRLLYTQQLGAWETAFGGHLMIRPMIRTELAGGSVLQDFVKTGFGPDAPVRIETETWANESLCLEDLILLKLVQDHLVSRSRNLRLNMGWELSAAISAATRAGKSGTKLMLHRDLAERIRTTYCEDAEALDARYFGGRALFRSELDRAVDEALPKPQSFEPTDHFNAETLSTISLMASQINVMLDHQSGPWSDFLKKRRIAALHAHEQIPPPNIN